MSIDLSSIQSSPPQVAQSAPAPLKNAGGMALAAESAEQVALPEKAPIRYDPEQQRQNLQEAIDRLNDQAERGQRNLHFSMAEDVNRFVITVKNKQSGEVVRQIPDEVVLKVAQSIEQMKGLLWNESV